MNGAQSNESHIGRFQIAACGTENTTTIAVLDTVTGRVWIADAPYWRRKLPVLTPESNGRPLWELPRR